MIQHPCLVTPRKLWSICPGKRRVLHHISVIFMAITTIHHQKHTSLPLQLISCHRSPGSFHECGVFHHRSAGLLSHSLASVMRSSRVLFTATGIKEIIDIILASVTYERCASLTLALPFKQWKLWMLVGDLNDYYYNIMSVAFHIELRKVTCVFIFQSFAVYFQPVPDGLHHWTSAKSYSCKAQQHSLLLLSFLPPYSTYQTLQNFANSKIGSAWRLADISANKHK